MLTLEEIERLNQRPHIIPTYLAMESHDMTMVADTKPPVEDDSRDKDTFSW